MIKDKTTSMKTTTEKKQILRQPAGYVFSSPVEINDNETTTTTTTTTTTIMTMGTKTTTGKKQILRQPASYEFSSPEIPPVEPLCRGGDHFESSVLSTTSVC